MKTIPIGASLVIMIGPSGSGKSTFIEKKIARYVEVTRISISAICA